MLYSNNLYTIDTGDTDNRSSWWTDIEYDPQVYKPIDFLRGDNNSVQEATFVDLKGRKKVVDGVSCSLGLSIMSDKVIQILNDHQFKGWRAIPILLDKKGQKISGFHCFQVLSECRPLNTSETYQTEIDWPFSPTGKRRITKGYSVELDECDGSDFYIPEGSRFVLCTQRVFEALSDAKLVDIRLRKLSDIPVNP